MPNSKNFNIIQYIVDQEQDGVTMAPAILSPQRDACQQLRTAVYIHSSWGSPGKHHNGW